MKVKIGRQNESVMNTDSVGNDALNGRQNRAASPRLKMVGNMIELEKLTTRIAHLAAWPWVNIEVTTNI